MRATTRRMAVAAVVLFLISLVNAQTWSVCNPTEQDNCPADPALGTFGHFNWTNYGKFDGRVWNTTAAGAVNMAQDAAEFSIAKKGDSPLLVSNFYIFWGRVSVVMKAAPGAGIVSAVTLQSDNLDEIDWEWLGGKTDAVSTNFFGKGDFNLTDRAEWCAVDNTLDVHNYTTVWTQDQIDWIIDGQRVRTLHFNDSLAMSGDDNSTSNVGNRYPQTPLALRIGPWAGGDSDRKGTREWAFNGTDRAMDYSKGPYVQSVLGVEVQDFSTGSAYTYSDKTGGWQSIKIAPGNSTIAEIVSKPSVSLTQRINSLSTTARIGIAVGAAAAVGVLLMLLSICCIRSRRAGRREKALADAHWDAQCQELQQYKHAMNAQEEIHPRAGYI